jgi:hypothetical protein
MKHALLFCILTIISNTCFANQLVTAIEKNSISQLRLFLDSGENPNTVSLNSNPLIRATLLNNYKIVKLLLEYNANPNLYDLAKTTPLHIAARKGNIEIVKILLKYNANPNLQDFSGFTSLLRAISNQNTEVAKLLLANQANINIANNNNYNGFDLIIKHNLASLIPILVEPFSYNNLSYLQILKQKSADQNRHDIVQELNKKINQLVAAKQQQAHSFIVTEDALEGYFIEDIKGYPCLNELYFIERSNVCLTIDNSPIMSIVTKKKSKKALFSANVTNQDIAFFYPTQNIKPLSWVAEHISVVLKKDYKKILSNITPEYKPSDPPVVNNREAKDNNKSAIIKIEALPNPFFISRKNITSNNQAKMGLPQKVFVKNSNYKKLEVINKASSKYMPVNLMDKSIFDDSYLNKQKANQKQLEPFVRKAKIGKAKFYIQIGVYGNKSNVARVRNKVKAFGAIKILPTKKNNQVLSKVLVGPFKSRLQANKLRYRDEFVKMVGSNKSFIVKLY